MVGSPPPPKLPTASLKIPGAAVVPETTGPHLPLLTCPVVSPSRRLLIPTTLPTPLAGISIWALFSLDTQCPEWSHSVLLLSSGVLCSYTQIQVCLMTAQQLILGSLLASTAGTCPLKLSLGLTPFSACPPPNLVLICSCNSLHDKFALGASLVAQWLRICLPMQGTRVRTLVWEDPTCRGATGPVSHNY